MHMRCASAGRRAVTGRWPQADGRLSPSGRTDLKTRGNARIPSGRRPRGFREMNVVLLPAILASYTNSTVADRFLCLQGTCLFGWVWSIVALTLLSAWIVRRWPAGTDDLTARLVPAATTAIATL